jgi:hypothetical protein
MEILMRILPGLLFATLLAPADAARGDATASGPVLEIVQFRLVAGIDPASFIRMAQATEAPLRRQPGYISRRLVQGGDGEWTDIVEWIDLAAATKAGEVIMTAPEFGPFGAAIDTASLRISHPALVWRMD